RSPSRLAVVRMPATSEPASGSVIAKQPIFSPETSGGMNFFFCSSLPNCKIVTAGPICMLIATRRALCARAISSVISTMAKKPSSPIFLTRSRRKFFSLSSRAALGAISFSANSRASSRTAIRSSDSSKSIFASFDEDRDRRSSILDSRLGQYAPRDDQFLNFRRAFVNAQRAHVAIKPLHDAAGDQTAAAMNLQGLIDDPLRRFGGVKLRHRGFLLGLGGRRIVRPGGLIHEQPGRLELRRHL